MRKIGYRMYHIPGACIALGLLSACGPRIDRFEVHGGQPGSGGADLPIPAPGRNLVATAAVTPFTSDLGAVTVAFKRTHPSVLEPPEQTLAHISTNSSGILSPSSWTFELVLPPGQVGPAAGATLPLSYPSIWEANLAVPYQAFPSSGTLNRTVKFQVEAPTHCQSFDRDASWSFKGMHKYLDSEGFNQQPGESNRLSTVTASRTETENYPELIPNTGALAVPILLNKCGSGGNRDNCVGNNDQWYGSFQGRLPALEGNASPDSLEVMIKGNLTLVQMGAETGPGGGMQWGPAASYVDAGNGWRRYRGRFEQPVTGVRRGGIRIQGLGYLGSEEGSEEESEVRPDSVVIDMVCRPAP